MGTYAYQALNTTGKRIKGVIEGDSERQARDLLRRQGLRPLQLNAGGKSKSERSAFRLSLFERGVSVNDMSLITRQLAVLLQSGLTVDEALQATARQCRRDRLKDVLLQVRNRITEGVTLAQAMGEHPKIFNNLYRALVRAGEHAGFLGPVLERLAEYTESRQQSQQKLKSAMVYPIVLILVAIAVVGAMMTIVVPKLVTIFESTAAELPGLTVGLIAISDFLQAYGLYSLLGIFMAVLLVRQLLQQEQRRRKFHGVLLRTPFIGEMVRGMETARFASTLSILTQSGVPLLDALQISREVFSNLVLQETADIISDTVREGGSLRKSMEESGQFPPMMVQMVASGEASGKLEEMLERAAINQERELEMTLSALMSLFQPMMVLVMAGMVLTIVLAVLLPMFELNDLVQ